MNDELIEARRLLQCLIDRNDMQWQKFEDKYPEFRAERDKEPNEPFSSYDFLCDQARAVLARPAPAGDVTRELAEALTYYSIWIAPLIGVRARAAAASQWWEQQGAPALAAYRAAQPQEAQP